VKVYSPTEEIFDKTYEEWIVKWWNHDFAYTAPVYLFVADYGDGDITYPIEFSSSIEALLLSPINFIALDDGNHDYVSIRNRAKEEIDIIDPSKITTRFDSEEIGHLATRYRTKIFQTTNDMKWGIGDGYWIFLKGPFKKGPHTLNTYGTCKSGQIQLSRSTDLLVV
jgi:hypothetical protein